MNSPLVTFVATAYKEEMHHMPFVDAMLAQTCKEFEAVIIHNGKPNIFKGFEGLANRVSGDIRFDMRCSPANSGNWGTKNRQTAIDECETEYIVQTSVQDYWLPQAVEYILKGLEQKPDILIWDSINHLVGKCQLLNAELAWSKIDWGNFALRTDIAKKVKIRQQEYCSDWLYLQDLLKEEHIHPDRVLKLSRILTIHN